MDRFHLTLLLLLINEFFKKSRKWRIAAACGQREQLRRGSPDYSCVNTALKKLVNVLASKSHWFPLLVLVTPFTNQLWGECVFSHSHKNVHERKSKSTTSTHHVILKIRWVLGSALVVLTLALHLPNPLDAIISSVCHNLGIYHGKWSPVTDSCAHPWCYTISK